MGHEPEKTPEMHMVYKAHIKQAVGGICVGAERESASFAFLYHPDTEQKIIEAFF